MSDAAIEHRLELVKRVEQLREEHRADRNFDVEFKRRFPSGGEQTMLRELRFAKGELGEPLLRQAVSRLGYRRAVILARIWRCIGKDDLEERTRVWEQGLPPIGGGSRRELGQITVPELLAHLRAYRDNLQRRRNQAPRGRPRVPEALHDKEEPKPWRAGRRYVWPGSLLALTAQLTAAWPRLQLLAEKAEWGAKEWEPTRERKQPLTGTRRAPPSRTRGKDERGLRALLAILRGVVETIEKTLAALETSPTEGNKSPPAARRSRSPDPVSGR